MRDQQRPLKKMPSESTTLESVRFENMHKHLESSLGNVCTRIQILSHGCGCEVKKLFENTRSENLKCGVIKNVREDRWMATEQSKK